MSLLLLFNNRSRRIDDVFIDYHRSESIRKAARIYIPEVTEELIKYIKKHPKAVYALSPLKFEELVAEIFSQQGFEVTLTPFTRDGGFDVIAVQRNDLTGESVHLIECKRYGPKQRVGVQVVRGLYGVLGQKRATMGIIVTTSYFSRDAEELAANYKAQLSLSDYDTFKKWLSPLPLAGRR